MHKYMHTECNSWKMCLSNKENISNYRCERTNITAKWKYLWL